MTSLMADVKFAFRMLTRSPGFAAVTIATLAMGIGANTAIFSVVNAVMIRPFPGVKQPERLLWIANHLQSRTRPLSYPDYVDQRDRATAFSDVLAFDRQAVNVAGPSGPERVEAELVSPNFFSVLGIAPAAGRLFEEDERSRRPAIVLSHAYWQRRFSGSAAALEATLTVNGRPYAVAGVAPRGFAGLDLERIPDIYVALPSYMAASAHQREVHSRDSSWLGVLARLSPGVPASRARESVRAIGASAGPERAADLRAMRTDVEQVRGWIPPGHSGELVPLALLGLAAANLVLLIAAANVANLLLGRGVARGKEIAVRLAIGASRGRIVRLLLVESLLLSLAGAAAGVAASAWGLDVLMSRLNAPPGVQPAADATVLLFALGVSVATALLFGLAPAWRASRRDLSGAFQRASGATVPHARAQRGLVVAQIALSLVLLSAAGLFLRSLQKAAAVEIGLDRKTAGEVVAASFDLETQGYDEKARAEFHRRLLERVAGLPGVSSVALAELLPLSGRAIGEAVAPAGREPARGEARMTFRNAVSPAYFGTLGIPLLAGRDFRFSDGPGAPPVAIVNETLARRFWPGENPVGKRLTIGDSREAVEIAGVARDGKYVSLTESPRPFVYLPILQRGSMFGETILLARSSAVPAVLPAIRSEVAALDPKLPLFHERTLAESLDAQLQDRRQGTFIIGLLGALAVGLAAQGLYAVVAYAVARRTPEIGIRMALGASQGSVVALFVGRGARLAAAGVAAGLLLSLVLTRFLSSLLFGVTPTDLATFAGVALLLTGVALAASFLPARRAAKTDPAIVLRQE